jgi:HlyD family secretion protein
MNVSADIVAARAENVLIIPAAAVQRGNLVLVSEENRGREGLGEIAEREGTPAGYIWARVSTGLTDGDFVEITSGLTEGMEIAYTPAVVASGDQNFMTFNAMPGGAMPAGGQGPGGQGGGTRQGGQGGGNAVMIRP